MDVSLFDFELLTERRPHDLTDRSVVEAARVLQDEEPARLASVDSSLRGPLDAVVAAIAAILLMRGIALVQALTQVQEITLTFVPKIVAILLAVAFSGPFVGAQIASFTNVVFQRIEQGF